MMKPDMHVQRLRVIRRAMMPLGLDALLVTDEHNRYYTTNFSGTTGSVLITATQAILYTDFRYTERAREEVPASITVEELHSSVARAVRSSLPTRRRVRLGVEDESLTVGQHQRLSKQFRGVALVGVGHTLTALRKRKDEYEIARLRAAVAATDSVFKKTVAWLRLAKRKRMLPTERAVANYVRLLAHAVPGGALAFPTIVAAGANAARPHHEPTSRRLRLGDEVVIDLGVALTGYHADMTRMVYLGTPSAAQAHRYQVCLRAQAAAILYLRAGGRSAGRADAVARAVIDKVYPHSFGHSLGHGVGLLVHEGPTLSAGSTDRLGNGMVFSIEPGIYTPNQGGVRIEDIGLIANGKFTVLSRSPKTLKASIL